MLGASLTSLIIDSVKCSHYHCKEEKSGWGISMNTRKSMFVSAALLGMAAVLVSCSPTPKPRASVSTKTVDPSLPRSIGEMTFGDVLSIAQNAPRMSCAELSFAHLQSGVLGQVSRSKRVNTNARTRLLGGIIDTAASPRLEAELNCHCDVITPMPGFELYERRISLLKTAKNTNLNDGYLGLYPKNEAGQPRFLQPGEDVSDDVLNQLPPAEIIPPSDDCGWSCKGARKRTNEKAIAEGKPEPFPGLKKPRKMACTPDELAALRPAK